jgi:hypothetical protein
MKFISTLFFGLSLVSLAGCGAEPAQGAWTPQYASASSADASASEFAPRSLVLERARFSVTFPCVPKTSKRPVVDETQFGHLRNQTYSCERIGHSRFVVMIGTFGAPPPALSDEAALLDQPTTKPTDAEVAKGVAVEFCNVLITKDHRISCTPGSPVDMGDVTDVEISFGFGSRRDAARVRVASPYIAAVGVVGNFEWDDLQKALDVKLPALQHSGAYRVVDQGRWTEPNAIKPYNAYTIASLNTR